MKHNKLSISLLKTEDAEALLAFERVNRKYFSSTLPDRGDDYFHLENITNIIASIEEEQKRDLCYMYTVRNSDEEIVGRVNLFSVVRGDMQSAELGYRIGEKHNRKGYGTAAAALAIREAFETHGLHRLYASTDPANIGSQIVLIKNRFQFTGRTPEYIQINEKWYDSIHFSLLRKDWKK
ncbi:N-acetyltransferase [Bacillus sp. M6-12]|uniref:GNAT family N-acetyltransferase n=1 Tax=Bacillus sp. M6-12 TaxID=2054166 RepID=UPI000C777391|nr:GNAT family protein [Bacillus sp. M6-12]PLS18412.1 N-acetyltransferase [Bacillus sp. M6-12]